MSKKYLVEIKSCLDCVNGLLTQHPNAAVILCQYSSIRGRVVRKLDVDDYDYDKPVPRWCPRKPKKDK